jgi:hypothetical protein
MSPSAEEFAVFADADRSDDNDNIVLPGVAGAMWSCPLSTACVAGAGDVLPVPAESRVGRLEVGHTAIGRPGQEFTRFICIEYGCDVGQFSKIAE